MQAELYGGTHGFAAREFERLGIRYSFAATDAAAVCAPAATSHAKLSAAERQRIGISDELLRLSVGVEHAEDLIADLAAALERGGRA